MAGLLFSQLFQIKPLRSTCPAGPVAGPLPQPLELPQPTFQTGVWGAPVFLITLLSEGHLISCEHTRIGSRAPKHRSLIYGAVADVGYSPFEMLKHVVLLLLEASVASSP